ncbi:MAG: biopolymer transporter ExbD [Marinilabiliaceae bacterium]|jgi:biopolymer transport protein ExbD|nr:biopolymer transporter ExbD [Marinilabiliaceae bacterium]
MSKFKRSTGKSGVGKINTASLPDIVFMLLFFFMTTTVMREVELKIGVTVPEATQGKKLEKKSLASFVYIGQPLQNLRATFGSEPKIQLNDAFKEVDDIQDFIAQERESLDETEKSKMLVSLKIDKATKMGIVVDVKQALRRANALKIMYANTNVDEIRHMK